MMPESHLFTYGRKARNFIRAVAVAAIIITSLMAVFSPVATLLPLGGRHGALVASAQTTAHPYVYTVNLGNVTVEKVIVINDHEVAVIGYTSKSSVITIYDISNPVVGARVIMSYPIAGKVTAVATNGYPVKRIAIGTSTGEILLFAVKGGRIYRLLQYIGGVDFPVRQLLVLTTPKTYKVAALVGGGRLGGGVCLNCEVYVIGELSKSVFRIGPFVGNASAASFKRVYPQLISAPLVVKAGEYYYDASHLFVSWLPYMKYVHLILNVTYLGPNGTVKPGAYAAIKVVAYNTTLKSRYVYGVNANAHGIADIIVPRGYDVNLTLWDIYGHVYVKQVKLSKFPRYATEIQQEITLRGQPLRTPMAQVYGQPDFTKEVVGVIDVSHAPYTYRLLGTLNMKLPRGVTRFGVVEQNSKYGSWYVLSYVDPTTGYLYLVRINPITLNVMRGVTSDYVGSGRYVSGLATFPNSPYLIVGLDNGIVKAYEWVGSTYRFVNEMIASGPIVKLKPATIPNKNIYVLLTRKGMQVVSIGITQFPYLRLKSHLCYTSGIVADGDALSSLTLAVLGGGKEITIIRNLNTALVGNVPINLNNYILPSMKVTVIPPPGELLYNGTLTITFPGGHLVYPLNNIPTHKKSAKPKPGRLLTYANTIVIPRIIPGETYTIMVNSTNTHLQNVTKVVTVSQFKNVDVTINVPYRIYDVTLSLIDTQTHKPPIGYFGILVDNKVALSNVSASRPIHLRLVYGNHTITIMPIGRYAKIYRLTVFRINVNKGISKVVGIGRFLYNLKAMVIDATTGKAPITPLIVRVNNSVVTILKSGSNEFSVNLVAGNYTLSVSPPPALLKVYKPVTIHVNLIKNYETTVELPRRTYLVNISVTDATIGRLIGKFDLYVNGTKMLSNIGARANITLPYGVYKFQLKPAVKYMKAYVPSNVITVKVFNNTKVSFAMRRMYYSLSVQVVDDLGNPIKNAKISVVNLDLGSVITQMYTDSNGLASASLFYGNYRLEVFAKGFYKSYKTILLDSSMRVRVTMQPELITVIFRYLPVMAIAAIAGVAIFIAMKVKAILTERLASKEEIF